MRSQNILPLAFLGLSTIVPYATAADVLKTNGFETCGTDGSIAVNNLDISYDRSSQVITFDVSGTSTKQQDVTANLTVSAYGRQIYQKSFDPCDTATFVQQMCPVPEGTFSAIGNQSIPSQFANMIPSIAFEVPDLDGTAQLLLTAKDGGQQLACIQSTVSNGKSVAVPAVSYVAATVAGAALAMSGLSALASGGHPGATTSSPTFTEVIWWFQGIAMNGMYSVQYPDVYRQFSKNFGFSVGLVSWNSMQTTIDNFRKSTGGNLTTNSYAALKNTTLVFSDDVTSGSAAKRSLALLIREVETSVNGSSSSNSSSSNNKNSSVVSNFKAYAEDLSVPQTNVFMTVLLLFCILVAAIIVSVLLFKVILEIWALFASFPKSLTTFRKQYWVIMFRTISSLIFLLYGMWVLYCIFQFTHGDSWGAEVLAAITLSLFTAVLAYYTFRIWQIAQRWKKLQGTENALYNDKMTWIKYKSFYENFKNSFWWFFIPVIIYMFAKGCVLAAGDGHGLVQTSGQLIIESLFLILLLWGRPYNTTSGKWINLVIQVVRVLSVVCILVFVEELGISQTTKTVTGVVLIAVQSGLTGLLAILIGVNALIACIRENPHRRRRKEAGKFSLPFILNLLVPPLQ